jgi:hypothetical protein
MHFSLQIGNKGSVDITATPFHVGCYSRDKGQDIIAIFTSDCTAQAIPLALLLQG